MCHDSLVRPFMRPFPVIPAATLVFAALLTGPLAAQIETGTKTSIDAPTPRLAAELVDARRTHLWRVLWWGGANLALGAGLMAGGREGHPTRYGFGLQAAAWGTINMGIATWGLLSEPGPAVGPAAILAAEDRWAHILLVNLGLNVGYIMVGTALHISSNHGLSSGDAVRGHADAVIVQGIGLLVLDGLAWISSSSRLEELRGLAFEGLRVGASALDPAAVEVAFRMPLG